MPKRLLAQWLFLLLIASPVAMASPPEPVSGEMVVVGREVISTPAGLIRLRRTKDGVTVQGPDFQGTAPCVGWDAKRQELVFWGSEGELVSFTSPKVGTHYVEAEALLVWSAKDGKCRLPGFHDDNEAIELRRRLRHLEQLP
jgi:hypothetical protein